MTLEKMPLIWSFLIFNFLLNIDNIFFYLNYIGIKYTVCYWEWGHISAPNFVIVFFLRLLKAVSTFCSSVDWRGGKIRKCY